MGALSTTSSAYIVAGTHSGVGKTTVTLTLLRALAAKGLSVQPFKLGPDFIDTAYHGEITGRPSINLDLWMMGTDNVKNSFERFSDTSDAALIEAMGALYDGEDGTERGSAAFIAKLLDIPVILVIDIWGMTRSAVPLLQGFRSFDANLRFAGFVMNRAGSARHAKMVQDSLPEHLQAMCLGYILHSDELSIPERHLGLVTPDENVVGANARLAALDSGRAGLTIDHLLPVQGGKPRSSQRPSTAAADKVRIAIARDQAFSFYYFENLALLEEAGAELCPFSPVSDRFLPADVSGVYIGGGYPESFAAKLASNLPLIKQLRQLTDQALPVYAECGGFMYLGRSLTLFDGTTKPMVGVFPIDIVMDPKHLAIRYVSVRTTVASALGPAGTLARGQEFHQSRIAHGSASAGLYDVTTSSGEQFEHGMLCGGVAGSYVHLHFASNPAIPQNFVRSCLTWSRGFS
ncbi:cobyrinate a,c-diamide synthase [Bradyrhizobium sp. 137]|uniref:cobyrinate a,c-diamide synthase n=1 Tax=Bradyrhizobium sp. 137 TaxID=2782614 RepID=UPI001FF90E68|nr:cobyrinate a,c-diamide synthase [Bradyrhizobium sp. 137]MCK1758367.1 cobyrinate a,c-diamide synthase [Bradyrhizobium sp. 137]